LSPERATPSGAPQPIPESPFLPDGVTIFLVDEDDAVRDSLVLSLRAAGHPAAAFHSARQFLDADRNRAPGCLVVDMDLPDGGAVGLLRKLALAGPVLPAIITSRRLGRTPPSGVLPAGPILFLDKPFGVDELLRLIRIVLVPGCGSHPAR
jgi:two-component system, LuxR family, response regulator FixJ